MSLTILGLGTSVPELRVRQEDAAVVAGRVSGCDERQAELLTTLYRHTDIAARHILPAQDLLVATLADVLAGHETPPLPEAATRGPTTGERMRIYAGAVMALATPAAQQALDEARVAAAAITHLITVSCTGFAAPGLDIGLIKALGIAPTVQRTHVGFMGCHGSFNALALAAASAAARSGACVLVCSAEICSLHYHYAWDVKRAVGNALFADGAAACVAAPARAGSGGWQLAATGSCLFPDSHRAMTWTIGDHGFDMGLSTRVPGLIAQHLRPWLEAWLRQQELGLDDVASWAVHPGGPRILDSVEAALGLPAGTTQVSRAVLAEYGNMSSATILFILERLRREDAPRPCVAVGFGPGLVAEALLFR